MKISKVTDYAALTDTFDNNNIEQLSIQARLCKIQGLLKDFSTVFKDWKLKKNTDLHIKILLLKCLSTFLKILV